MQKLFILPTGCVYVLYDFDRKVVGRNSNMLRAGQSRDQIMVGDESSRTRQDPASLVLGTISICQG
jgi:hypothetical protein